VTGAVLYLANNFLSGTVAYTVTFLAVGSANEKWPTQRTQPSTNSRRTDCMSRIWWLSRLIVYFSLADRTKRKSSSSSLNFDLQSRCLFNVRHLVLFMQDDDVDVWKID